MYQIPLFNSDILHHIYTNFLFYFTAHNIYQCFIAVILILFINWLIVKYLSENRYSAFVPESEEENKNKSCKMAFGVLFCSFALYVLRFVAEEQTILNNYDSMSPGFLGNLLYGVIPVIKGWRFTPLSHIDGMVVYGITNNYFAIGCYCVLKQILVLYLMYRFFSFISKPKRILLLALINFVPAVFCVNNAVFPEQNMIIFVLLSLMGLNKFQKSCSARYLLCFLCFMNCAIYTKETVILFYLGYGIYLLFEGMGNGRISFGQMKRPWKQWALMPAEWLMFVSMLIWVMLYYEVTPEVSNNRYLMTHTLPMLQLLRVYAVELLICFVALYIFGKKLYYCRFSNMSLFMEGSVIGSVILAVYVVFGLKIVPSQDYSESYYLYLPAVFCTVYIFCNIEQAVIKKILALLIALLSLYQNCDFFINMNGSARRELMNFIETKAPKIKEKHERPMVIYFYSANLMVDTVFWRTTGWSASFYWMLRDRDILVKMDKYYKDFVTAPYSKLNLGFETVASGDYVVINRKDDPDLQGTNILVYRNKVYDVYLMQ